MNLGLHELKFHFTSNVVLKWGLFCNPKGYLTMFGDVLIVSSWWKGVLLASTGMHKLGMLLNILQRIEQPAPHHPIKN